MNSELQKKILNTVEQNLPELYEIRNYLYENPEVGARRKKLTPL